MVEGFGRLIVVGEGANHCTPGRVRSPGRDKLKFGLRAGRRLFCKHQPGPEGHGHGDAGEADVEGSGG